jgi:hypothetical protein
MRHRQSRPQGRRHRMSAFIGPLENRSRVRSFGSSSHEGTRGRMRYRKRRFVPGADPSQPQLGKPQPGVGSTQPRGSFRLVGSTPACAGPLRHSSYVDLHEPTWAWPSDQTEGQHASTTSHLGGTPVVGPRPQQLHVPPRCSSALRSGTANATSTSLPLEFRRHASPSRVIPLPARHGLIDHSNRSRIEEASRNTPLTLSR